MCGRSTLHDAPVNILDRFSLPPVLPGFQPRYNIAPSQLQWTLLLDDTGAPAVRPIRWGLVPSWAKDPLGGSRLINARAESVAEKPAFSESLRKRRCVVLADGYYEWRSTTRERVPMFFHLGGHMAFGFAALWDRWGNGDTALETCTIITTRAGRKTAPYHHRMPAILRESAAAQWMRPSAESSDLLELLTPYDSDDLQAYEVSKLVNSPANDSVECIAPAASGSQSKRPPDQLELDVPGF
ncbi:MAG TPA: SOS response-associated peptidase [Gemmatimonadaceae bacterium]|nr:SOS response-associated peptidase [Gemmatimonadaceae bacterium]